jgi:hypothetical protein
MNEERQKEEAQNKIPVPSRRWHDFTTNQMQKSQFLVFNQFKVLALQYHSMQETLFSVF